MKLTHALVSNAISAIPAPALAVSTSLHCHKAGGRRLLWQEQQNGTEVSPQTRYVFKSPAYTLHAALHQL
jgi:hypothetical protein